MSKKQLSQQLIPKNRIIFFNEGLHKYTDEFDNVYTSATTLIGKYINEEDFEKIAEACEKIGRNPNHPKYLRYKDKRKKQILYEWKEENLKSLIRGNEKHDYLEESVKEASHYKRDEQGLICDQLYTIDTILSKHKFGRLNLEHFIKTGVRDKYPQIFAIIERFVKAGFKIYSEIGCYDYTTLISGLIDILFVRDNEFLILDWKTNKSPMRREAGYFEKDDKGMLQLNNFIHKDKYMKYPINHLEDSTYNHYALQLAIYASLIETWGLKYLGSILCHIRGIEEYDVIKNEIFYVNEIVEIHDMDDLRSDAKLIINHHASNNLHNNSQLRFID